MASSAASCVFSEFFAVRLAVFSGFLEMHRRQFEPRRQQQRVAVVRGQFQRLFHRPRGLVEFAGLQQVVHQVTAVQHARLVRLRVLRLEPFHPLVGISGAIQAVPQDLRSASYASNWSGARFTAASKSFTASLS